MPEQTHYSLEILRRREVQAKTGLSRSTIYEKIRSRTFPMPISLGGKSVGWIKAEVEAWIHERIRLSRPANASTNSAQEIASSPSEGK